MSGDLSKLIASLDSVKSECKIPKRPGKPAGVNSRIRLFIASRGVCFFCGATVEWRDFSPDHATPRILGGRSFDNLLPSCRPCNKEKGARQPTHEEIVEARRFGVVSRSIPTSTLLEAKAALRAEGDEPRRCL